MRKTLVVFALTMLPAMALAGEPYPTPPGVSRPTPVGSPHICPPRQWYPRAAIRRSVQGIVGMIMRIGTDGAVKDLVVASSSGDQDIDLAAANCVSTFRYTPAMKDGAPIMFDWSTSILMRVSHGHPELPSVPPTLPVVLPEDRCDAPPPGGPARAVAAITVAADGSVRDLTVVKSSGDAAFDKYAASCIGAWHYRPSVSESKAVDAPWAAQIFRGE